MQPITRTDPRFILFARILCLHEATSDTTTADVVCAFVHWTRVMHSTYQRPDFLLAKLLDALDVLLLVF